MANRYQLPCDCGKTLNIDTSQAGLALTCECGKQLEVPSLRGIRALDPVEEGPPQESSSKKSDAAPRPEPVADPWGPQQGTMLAGGLLMVCGLLFASVMWWTKPVYEVPEVDVNDFRRSAQTWTLDESFKYWEIYRQGIDRTVDPYVQHYENRVAIHSRWCYAGLGFAVIGLALLLSGRFLSFGDARRPLD